MGDTNEAVTVCIVGSAVIGCVLLKSLIEEELISKGVTGKIIFDEGPSINDLPSEFNESSLGLELIRMNKIEKKLFNKSYFEKQKEIRYLNKIKKHRRK